MKKGRAMHKDTETTLTTTVETAHKVCRRDGSQLIEATLSTDKPGEIDLFHYENAHATPVHLVAESVDELWLLASSLLQIHATIRAAECEAKAAPVSEENNGSTYIGEVVGGQAVS